jgi:hypothetical protein
MGQVLHGSATNTHAIRRRPCPPPGATARMAAPLPDDSARAAMVATAAISCAPCAAAGTLLHPCSADAH